MVFAPPIAYGHIDAFDMGRDYIPHEETDYREYKFLGRLPLGADDQTKADLLPVVREKYGPEADVFRTGRFWVVYRIL